MQKKIKTTHKKCIVFIGAEGEIRTLAPVARPTPLAGAPRHQLEYFSVCAVINDAIQFFSLSQRNQNGGESGIRTHGALPHDGFQDRSVITTSVSLHRRIGTNYILSYPWRVVKQNSAYFKKHFRKSEKSIDNRTDLCYHF